MTSRRVVGHVALLALSASCWSHTPSLATRAAAGPVELIELPENHLIRWPSIAVLSDTVFVATNVFPIVGDSLDARPAYLGRLRETSSGDLVALPPLDLPPGDFQFAYPRIISASGRLHLVWAEFGSAPRIVVGWPQAFATSLWHSVRDNGSWSAPEKIATSQWFGWSDEAGGVAVDGTGSLHVAVWAGDSGSISRVDDIHLTDGRWSTSRAANSGLNHSTTIVAHGDTVVIGFVGTAIDTQRVMLVESTDRGNDWKTPIVASQRTGGDVAHLALATMADGQLLAIAEKAWDSFSLDTIRVLRMRRSTGPSTAQIVTPPLTAAGFDLAAAPCGSIVMLIRTFSLTPQIFEATIPRDSTGAVIRPLLSTAAVAAFPGVAAGRRSVIAVFAYTATRGTPARSVAMSLPGC